MLNMVLLLENVKSDTDKQIGPQGRMQRSVYAFLRADFRIKITSY